MAKITPILQTWKDANRAGENRVLLRIEAANKRRYVSLKIGVKKKHWNKRTGRIRTSHPQEESLNALIEKSLRKANDTIIRLQLEEIPVTVDSIKQSFSRTVSTRDFWGFAGPWLDEKHRRGQIHYWRRARAVLRKFEASSGRPLPWSSFALTTLRAFDTHMVGMGNSGNTRGIAFKLLKTIVHDAIKQDIIMPDSDPFTRFTMPASEEVDRLKLTLHELDALLSVKLEPDSWEGRARDLYVMAYYMRGTRFGDIVRMRAESITDGRAKFRMGKNNAVISLPLTPEIEAVLDRWGLPDAPNGYLFPPLRGVKFKSPQDEVAKISAMNALVNRGLKNAARAAGIEKPISIHTARHTFSHHAYQKGIDTRDIQRALRHTKSSTTDAYLKSLDDDGLDEKLEQMYRREKDE